MANMWTNAAEASGVAGVDDDGNGFIDDVYGIDSINGDSDPMDDDGHGTHTAGTSGAVGNNGIGVTGVAWDVQIMALKFLGANGGTTSGAIELIDYMTMMKTVHGQNIVARNNSWGGGGFSQALDDSISASNAAGILFVAAAGNNGTDNDVSPHYPSNYTLPGIISVGATDHNDDMAGFTNWGANSVDLSAPGVNILSTQLGGRYVSFNGTSMATPHVTGAVAVLAAANPGATIAELKTAILAGVDLTADPQKPTLTDGRLNLANSLAILGGGATPETVEFDRDSYEVNDDVMVSVRDIDLAGTSTVNVTISSSNGDTETVVLGASGGPGSFSGTISTRFFSKCRGWRRF